MDDIESIITRNEEPAFEEAVRYFGERVPVTPGQFYKIVEEYRGLAFTISGYTSVQVLKKFYDELLGAIEDGETMESFRSRMNSFLEEKGYEGVTPFQADNIFRTNTQTAYQVGHYEQMTDPGVLKLRPFWQYDAVNDRHTRPSHLAMDGRVFPADSPYGTHGSRRTGSDAAAPCGHSHGVRWSRWGSRWRTVFPLRQSSRTGASPMSYPTRTLGRIRQRSDMSPT
ncbi:phage minor head protein [Hungatella sp.]|uniref:phage head morphogenesis protein n=1 Tax=Hungatella sp. TaxID=2613924 RepID=UPI0039A01DDB